MRSRTSPENSELSSSSFQLFSCSNRAFADRPMRSVKIVFPVLCALLFGPGCAVPKTAFVPPITAATAGATINPAPDRVMRDTASPGPVIQATNDDDKITTNQNLSSLKRKKAPGISGPSKSIRLGLTGDHHPNGPAPKNRRAGNGSPQVPMAAAGNFNVRVVPADKRLEAAPIARRIADEKAGLAPVPPAKKDSEAPREDRREPNRVKIDALPGPLSNSGDLALRIVGEESDETAAVRPGATDTALAAISMLRNLSGTFAGTSFRYAKGQISLAEITFTIGGSGDDVTGTWSSARGTSGKINGTIEGSAIRQLRLEQYGPCSGTYAGLAIVVREGSMLDGSYAGADCEGRVDGSFIVRKE